MSVLFPATEIHPAKVDDLRRFVLRQLSDLCRQASGSADVIARSLRAGDVEGSVETAVGLREVARLRNPVALVADTWARDVYPGVEVPKNAAWGVFGVALVSERPALDCISLGVGGVPVAELSTTVLCAFPREDEDVPVDTPPRWRLGYVAQPVLVGPGEHLSIGLLAHRPVVVGGEDIVLIGYVVEPVGRHVMRRYRW